MSVTDSELTQAINLIAVGVVALNEEASLKNLLQQIEAQDFPHEKIEILLVDSNSDDNTKRIMEEFAETEHGFSRVVVLNNPKKILPAGWNVLLDNYSGDAIVRIDAHANIPTDFVSNNVAVLEQGYGMCGGTRPCVVGGEASEWQNALLTVEESMFGAAFADYRREPKACFVDSVFHPAFRREVIEKIGLFDERLVRTEDNDISYRVRKAGYQIRFDPRIKSQQHIRPNLRQMIKQKYSNGYWIGKTLFIQPRCIGFHHLVPGAFVSALTLVSLFRLKGFKLPARVLLGSYLATDFVISFSGIKKLRQGFSRFLIPVLFPILHIAYGIGTWKGIWDAVRKR